jgi:hypothetical protein
VSYRPWKHLERKHAKRMPGGKRITRAHDFGEKAPDGESETDVWDTKSWDAFKRCLTIFRECRGKYVEYARGRRFHLVISSQRDPLDLVVLDADDYADLVRCQLAVIDLLDAVEEAPDGYDVLWPEIEALRDRLLPDPIRAAA